MLTKKKIHVHVNAREEEEGKGIGNTVPWALYLTACTFPHHFTIDVAPQKCFDTTTRKRKMEGERPYLIDLRFPLHFAAHGSEDTELQAGLAW